MKSVYYCYYYVCALHMYGCALESECVYVYVSAALPMRWLQLWLAGTCQRRVLGTELLSSGRTGSSLHH